MIFFESVVQALLLSHLNKEILLWGGSGHYFCCFFALAISNHAGVHTFFLHLDLVKVKKKVLWICI